MTTSTPAGALPLTYAVYEHGRWDTLSGGVVAERLISLFVNGQELATLMTTPRDLPLLALGWLANEGLIASRADVRAIHVCPSEACVDVWLNIPMPALPPRLILTSGCGGGVTFDDLSATRTPLTSTLTIAPETLCALMTELQGAAQVYRAVRGIHTAALANAHGLVFVAEDIGRHNTLDKLRGLCLQNDYDPRDHILLCTGRISSEMLVKAMKMQVPLIASRTSPTSLSVQLAHAWNLTLVGYLRGRRFQVYTGEARVHTDPAPHRALQEVAHV